LLDADAADVENPLWAGMDNRFHSPYVMTAVVAAIPEPSQIPIDSEASALVKTTTFNDLEGPQQAAKVNGEQEWEIHDIIGREVVGGVVHYWVQWEPTLVPEYELPKAKALVEKFEARLQAQGRQKDGNGKGQGNAPKSKIGQQAMVGASITRQQKRPRGRSQKHM
jgi:hypothetical protein